MSGTYGYDQSDHRVGTFFCMQCINVIYLHMHFTALTSKTLKDRRLAVDVSCVSLLLTILQALDCDFHNEIECCCSSLTFWLHILLSHLIDQAWQQFIGIRCLQGQFWDWELVFLGWGKLCTNYAFNQVTCFEMRYWHLCNHFRLAATWVVVYNVVKCKFTTFHLDKTSIGMLLDPSSLLRDGWYI